MITVNIAQSVFRIKLIQATFRDDYKTSIHRINCFLCCNYGFYIYRFFSKTGKLEYFQISNNWSSNFNHQSFSFLVKFPLLKYH
jgi:hypothetical protein